MLTKLKRRLMRRNKGGFTLAEVIVSCALLGILLLGMILFINPVLKGLQGEQQNARANVVAASIEHYITRSVRSTTFVKVFTEATFEDNRNGQTIGDNTDLDAMRKWAEDNKNIYEVQCISIRKIKDQRSDVTRYKLCQEFFDASGYIDSSYTLSVFDDCFYEGLFPQITITQANVQYKDGTIVMPSSSASPTASPTGTASPSPTPTTTPTATDTPTPTATDLPTRPGLEIDINIYDDEEMKEYSRVFSGYGLTELFMIMTDEAKTKNKQGYKIYESESIGTGTDTYIYYIARKAKPAASVTPTPTPTPTDTPTPSPT